MATRWRLRPGVLVKAYPDGVVVYVPDTCETHILAPGFEAVLDASLVQQLVQLKIAEPSP